MGLIRLVDIFPVGDAISRPMADTPKRRPRRRFADDFKAQAVRLDEGKSVGGVARDLDLTETALREWVNRARADGTNGRTGLTTAEREELARLRRKTGSCARRGRSQNLVEAAGVVLPRISNFPAI